jgi:hypothetical protein
VLIRSHDSIGIVAEKSLMPPLAASALSTQATAVRSGIMRGRATGALLWDIEMADCRQH